MNLRHLSVCIFILAVTAMSMASEHNITIVYTTDVHGNFFPYNFITRTPGSGSMARVAAYVDSLRASENIILLDNGDILQGQPAAYYFNYIETGIPHIASRIYDYMKYDAATIGNHDIETGHDVYDRYRHQTGTTILGANVIDKCTGEPYLAPYKIIERNGLRVAVIGMLTPAIPAWLPENLWSGLEFADIAESAKKWIPIIKADENPDLIIGLFHSGADASADTSGYNENASVSTAKQVSGFDAIFMGHDHRIFNGTVCGPDGSEVTILNPANNADNIGILKISVTKNEAGKLSSKTIKGDIVSVDAVSPSVDYLNHFKSDYDAVNRYVNRCIGYLSDTITTRDAFFGSSPFMNLIHRLQLDISGADISFAAPLSFDAKINKGKICVSDMFTLYKYENMLYVITLSGQEIKNYLEMSYDLWTRQINSDNKHIINFAEANPDKQHNRLLNPSYNFDSAYGIVYDVDITKPKGEKINIRSMADGTKFSLDSVYKVALNSYRGNGGGNLLTLGAGIPRNEIKKRMVCSTDKDLRYYLMKRIAETGYIIPDSSRNWQFIPADIAKPILEADCAILFSGKGLEKQK